MRRTIFHRFGYVCLRFGHACLHKLARCPRPRTGLGRAGCVFVIMALAVMVVSAIITPPTSHQQAAATPADMAIIHRMMQDQRAIARATRTYTLSTFAERFGHKGD